jgi:hypothetical protein
MLRSLKRLLLSVLRGASTQEEKPMSHDERGESYPAGDKYLLEMETHLHEWDAQADDLRARAMDDDAKIDYYKQMALLRPRREAMQSLLDQLRNADNADWQRIKGDLDVAWDDLRNALDTATERVI